MTLTTQKEKSLYGVFVDSKGKVTDTHSSRIAKNYTYEIERFSKQFVIKYKEEDKYNQYVSCNTFIDIDAGLDEPEKAKKLFVEYIFKKYSFGPSTLSKEEKNERIRELESFLHKNINNEEI